MPKPGEPPCNSLTSNWLKTIPSTSSRTSSLSPVKSTYSSSPSFSATLRLK